MSYQPGGQPPAVPPWQMQQTMLPPKSSRDTKIALIVVAVTVVIVLAAVFAWWFLSQGLVGTNGGGPTHALGLSIGSAGANWTMTVASVSGNMRPSEVSMTMFDQNGALISPMSSVPLSDLTLANWVTYKVAYQKLSAGNYIGVGDRILVDKMTYWSGCRFQIKDASTILSTGRFS